jgi:NNP family nitrate/nitrite transporter-like MFS transporter
MLVIPKMDIYSPGQGIMNKISGTVAEVSETHIVVDQKKYPLKINTRSFEELDEGVLVFPTISTWQEPAVKVGQKVKRRELLARGITRIYFQANVWIFAGLVMVLGVVWGIGKASVYKLIPDYYPEEVGIVGGMVGVLGGLGGFVSPIIFGYLLEHTGLWTTCWMFMWVLSVICLFWLHNVVQLIQRREHPESEHKI